MVARRTEVPWRSRSAVTLVTLALTTVLTTGLAAGAAAPAAAAIDPTDRAREVRAPSPSPAAPGDRLSPGQRVRPGGSLVSSGGAAVLLVQRSGRLALYGADGGVVWSADGAPGAALVLDARGRLRLVAPDGSTAWEPEGGPAALAKGRLLLRDDGDLVLQDPTGAVVWATGTGVRPSRLAAGGSVTADRPLASADGRHVLLVRRSGDLALLGPDSRARWVAPGATPAASLDLAQDGTLALHDDAGAVLWTPGIAAVPGAELVLRDDGELVLVGPDGTLVWTSGTALGPAALLRGEALAVGEHLDSSDGRLRLSLEPAALLLTYDGTEVWRAPVVPGAGATLNMRVDGRLVLRDERDRPVWSTTLPDEHWATRPSLRLDPLGMLLTAGTGQEVWRVDVPPELVEPAAPHADCSTVDGPVPVAATVLTEAGVRVHACLADAVDAMVAAARADGVHLVASGWRSREQQIAARARNCRTVDGRVRCHPPTAVPGLSRHEWGLALDITDRGALVRVGTPAWEWLVAHAGTYGLTNLPGEPWHWSVDGW